MLCMLQHTHETDAVQACAAIVAIAFVLQQHVYVVCTLRSLLLILAV